jgi:Glu-tRNA(Gln) amidotransferase subunit E-like FAD-binding protein
MIDYGKLGFKCGIEVHQQLEGKKLFCNCPTLNSTKEPDVRIERRLRASAGEMGKTDAAALHEMAKSKLFIYEADSEDTCLVECDSEPPHPINKKALETTLQIALLLNAKVVDEIQIMRKTVVDGSNTSGFQRTALVATDGYIETSLGKVGISVICLEEEAAQKIKEDESSITYRLDRLGIPLIEIGTEADIKSPEHAKEVAAYLGMVLRSTGSCKRGIGSIRQDVNISIKGGARTEIKGFQDLRSIVKVSENETQRQQELVNQGKKIKEEVRKSKPDFTTAFLRPMPGASRMYPETDLPQIAITKDILLKIKKPELITEKAIGLEKKYNLKPELAKELLDNKFFEELADKYKNIKPSFIAHTLINIPKDIKSRLELNTSKIKEADFDTVLNYLNENKIPKEAVLELLSAVCKGSKIDISKYKAVSEDKLEDEVAKIVKEKQGLSIGAYMGIVMGKYRGKVDGKKVMGILKKIV